MAYGARYDTLDECLRDLLPEARTEDATIVVCRGLPGCPDEALPAECPYCFRVPATDRRDAHEIAAAFERRDA